MGFVPEIYQHRLYVLTAPRTTAGFQTKLQILNHSPKPTKVVHKYLDNPHSAKIQENNQP